MTYFRWIAITLGFLGAALGARPAPGQEAQDGSPPVSVRATPAPPQVECLTPLGKECDISLAPGAARVPINVRIVRDGQPVDGAAVSFTTSQCCLEPASGQQMRTSATGIATITWAGTVRDDSAAPARVYVWGRADGDFLGNVVIRPKLDVAYKIEPVDDYVIWFRDDQIPEAIEFRITRANGAKVSEDECNRFQVAFTPHLGGTAGPSPASARYSDGACTVGASWKLANSVGRQFLHAKIVGGEGSMRMDANVTAIARQPPRFIAGFARFMGGDREEGEEEVEPLKSVFGVDFPLFYEDVCSIGFCKRLRVVVGSSFLDPGEDYYAGVVLIPLAFGTARESLPIQATANIANGERYFLALTVDASSVLQMALNSLTPK